MDGATNNNSVPSATNITGDRQTSPALIETDSRPLFSSDYYRKVDRTTNIAGRLSNAVFTLPPRLVQAIVGGAELSTATRQALVAECKKFYLANKEYEENKEVFVDGETYCESTTITLDCGRLYTEGYNEEGQCRIGSEEEVTGPRLIRLPPVLKVWHHNGSWFANTTRGLYSWGWNDDGRLGVGSDDRVDQPRRVLIDEDVLNVSMLQATSFLRTASGWFGCGDNYCGQLGLGHTDAKVTTPTPIPGSEGVTRWGGNNVNTFGFSDAGLLACGANDEGQCGVGSTDEMITALTPVALPDDVKGRVDRVGCYGGSSFFIAGRRCFGAGFNLVGELGLGSNQAAIRIPTELPVPVDDILSFRGVTVIRSGDTLLAFGLNLHRQISADRRPKLTTPTPLNPPGPVVKVIVDCNIFVQLADAAWVGRGEYESYFFTPVPEADLIDRCSLPEWTPVSDEHAENLNAREAAEDVMVLPEPINA